MIRLFVIYLSYLNIDNLLPVVPEICHGQVHVPRKERKDEEEENNNNYQDMIII
jgi:hypothetical protein